MQKTEISKTTTITDHDPAQATNNDLAAALKNISQNAAVKTDPIADALDRLTMQDTNQQIRAIADRMGKIATDVAVHTKIAETLEKNFEKITEEQARQSQSLATIEEMANKWKGGFFVIAGLGGALGLVLAFWERISKTFGGH